MSKEKTISKQVNISTPDGAAILNYRYIANEKDPVVLGALYLEIQESNKRLKNNDFSDIEEILNSQIQVLHFLTSKMISDAAASQNLKQTSIYVDIALKAQNNLRKTAETLLNIKRPSNATFIKNQAQNQQFNLGVLKELVEKPLEIKNQPNELLSSQSDEVLKNEKMDTIRA